MFSQCLPHLQWRGGMFGDSKLMLGIDGKLDRIFNEQQGHTEVLQKQTESQKQQLELMQQMKETIEHQANIIRQSAYGEVDPDAPVHVRVAQSKTQYCRYLVMIQRFQTEKLEMKAEALQKKADEKAEAAQKRWVMQPSRNLVKHRQKRILR